MRPPSDTRPTDASRAPAPDAPTEAEPGAAACWPSEMLLRGRQVVAIDHQGVTYLLRLTRQGKLILTK